MNGVRGDRVLLARRDLGMTQEDVARVATIDRGYISQIERSKQDNIGVQTVFALAKALGVDPGYLMGLTDNPLRGIQDEEEESATIKEENFLYGNELMQLYQSLPTDDQEFLLEMARKLKRADTPRIIGQE